MQIKIKTLKGEIFDVEIDESAAIIDLKRQIDNLRSVPIERQKLVYKGKSIEDTTIIGETSIRDGDFIVLMNSFPKKKQEIKQNPIVENKNKIQNADQHSKSQIKEAQSLRKNVEGQLMQKPKKQEKQENIVLSAQQLLQQKINEESLQLLINGLNGGAGSVQIENSQGIIDQLAAENPELSRLIQQKPEILQQILMSGVHYEEVDGSESWSQEELEMQLTEQQNKAIQRVYQREYHSYRIQDSNDNKQFQFILPAIKTSKRLPIFYLTELMMLNNIKRMMIHSNDFFDCVICHTLMENIQVI